MAVRSDKPIQKSKDDTLGRARVAKSYAKQIQALDASEGLVVGVLGPWGSGKTSLLNLTRAELEKKRFPIIAFNPWMFSGANQLMDSFFAEISSQLKLKHGDLRKIGKDIEEYGEILSALSWLPFGAWIERIRLFSKGASKLLQKKKEGTSTARKKITESLQSIEKPIVVIVDDIDRLNTAEIRDIFKLVRLTASFPNIIYILAFDRSRVEEALSEDGIPGRDYLEKILQLAIDLPVVPPDVLNKQIFEAITEALKNIKNEGLFDEDKWPDIYYEIIRPLIRNMRDVRRYAIAIRGTVESLEGKVALHDVLALEAVRIFLPDVYSEITKSVEGLTAMSSGYGRDDPPRLKESIERIIEKAQGHEDLVKDMIKRLFPAAQRHIENMSYGLDYLSTWLKERRVAHENILKYYLERQGNEKLDAFSDAEKAFEILNNEVELDKYLRSLDPKRLEDVIEALENFEHDYTQESVVPAVAVLLNLLPDLPEKESRVMFDLDSKLVVGRVVYRLMKSLQDKPLTEEKVREILPKLKTMTAKYELITDVGYRQGAGHKLVTEDTAKEFEKELRDEIRASNANKLAAEKELVRLLYAVIKESAEDEPPLALPNSTKLTHAILLNSRSKVMSNSMGNRAVQISYRLPWDILVQLFGTEENLKLKVNAAKTKYPESKETFDLFDKYASGWRPEHDE